MTSIASSHSPLLGPALIFISTLFWPMADGFAKLILVQNIGIIILHFAFFRGVCMYAMGAGIMGVQKRPLSLWQILHHPQLKSGLLRGTASFATTFLVLSAVQRLSLGEAISVVFASPFIVMILSPFVVGERFTINNFIAVCCGFIGVLVIINPSVTLSEDTIMGYVFAILAAFSMASVILICRLFKANDQILSYCTTGLAYGGLSLLGLCFVYSGGYIDSLFPDFTALTWQQNILFACAILAGCIGVTIGQTGFSYTTATLGALIAYGELIWVGIMDYILFDIIISLQTLTGMLLIVGAGVFGLYHDYKK